MPQRPTTMTVMWYSLEDAPTYPASWANECSSPRLASSGQCPPPRRGRTQGPSSLQLPASSGQGHRLRFPRTKYSQHPPGGRPGSPRQWHLGRQPSHSSTRTTGIRPGTGQGDLSFNFSYRQEFTDFNNQEIFLDTGCILQGSLLLLYGF